MSADASPSALKSAAAATRPDDDPDNHPNLIEAAATRAAAQLHSRRNVSVGSSSDVPMSGQDDLSSIQPQDARNPSGSTTPSYPANQIQFRSNTIAPSPPLPGGSPNFKTETSAAESQMQHEGDEGQVRYQPSPLSSGSGPEAISALRVKTDIIPPPPRTDSLNSTANLSTTRTENLNISLQHKTSASSLKPVSRTPSFKTGALAGFFSPSSAASSRVASPIISAMGDVTPLPSPLLSSDSPGPWKKEFRGRLPSREGPGTLQTIPGESVLVTTTGESISAALANQSKRKAYASLGPSALSAEKDSNGESTGTPKMAHTRNRSLSEYVPENVALPKRMITVSGSHVKTDIMDEGVPHMRREPHLSEVRGLTPVEKPPTPPPSESSVSATDSTASDSTSRGTSKQPTPEFYEAIGVQDGKRRRWKAIRPLGQGTFSRVMLATSQTHSPPPIDTNIGEIPPLGEGEFGKVMLATSDFLDDGKSPIASNGTLHYDRKTLVAVKICEHGPRGGASEERIEMSLKRELELMQDVSHPSIVHLKAWSIEPTRALLVLSYCPGGDLFDIASQHRALLTAPLLRRIFAELVGAVTYLHERRIVHRDIKLENVLVNLHLAELASSTTNWQTYPYSVVTLTDLGLSRRIADDERLTTRCGSDDYAAPEVIMGQGYDGRATDAWSLGVLLYALLEARLPFDPHPGAVSAAGGTGTEAYVRLRSRTSHRIARVEWRWIEYAGEDGDHEGSIQLFAKRDLVGAMEVTEGLLKRARSRWTLEKVAQTEWVGKGIEVEGGVRFHPEDEAEVVS